MRNEGTTQSRDPVNPGNIEGNPRGRGEDEERTKQAGETVAALDGTVASKTAEEAGKHKRTDARKKRRHGCQAKDSTDTRKKRRHAAKQISKKTSEDRRNK